MGKGRKIIGVLIIAVVFIALFHIKSSDYEILAFLKMVLISGLTALVYLGAYLFVD